MTALLNKRIRATSPKRRKKRYDEEFGAKAGFIRDCNCVVCGRHPSEPHHVKSRGAGGKAEHLVPLCHEHHRELHGSGHRTFQEKHNVDLVREAQHYHERWETGVAGAWDLDF